MNKRLQIHVLENIRDNGQWVWGWKTEILYNTEAHRRFEGSPFNASEYSSCTAMLVESRKVVAHNDHDFGTKYSPLCLTVDGLQYLSDIKHPGREWAKQNWFAVLIASTTMVVSMIGIVVNVMT